MENEGVSVEHALGAGAWHQFYMLWGDASQVHEVVSQHPLLRLVLATNGPGISVCAGLRSWRVRLLE
jgi:hypothetical protein